MENVTAKKEVGLVMRMLFFVFGVVTASAGFVVACVLARDHYEYTFVQVWLTIAAIVLIFAIGLMWIATGLSDRRGKL